MKIMASFRERMFLHICRLICGEFSSKVFELPLCNIFTNNNEKLFQHMLTLNPPLNKTDFDLTHVHNNFFCIDISPNIHVYLCPLPTDLNSCFKLYL